MAKYRRYRKYSRRGRSRWLSNLVDIPAATASLSNVGGYNYVEQILITNPEYANTFTSSLYTIKNVEVTLQFDATLNNSVGIENIQFYIMYIPQDMQLTEDYPIKHPEFIMAMRYYGEPGQDTTTAAKYSPSIKIKTRLARKLHAGDRVSLFIRAFNTSGNPVMLDYGGLCRFWTKSN